LVGKGVKIVMVTTDGWQSVDTQQLLHRAGIEAEVLSLDRTHDQYVSFRNLFYEERAQHSGHPVFMKEAEELEHNRIKKKVDHPYSGSKDVADAACGCAWKCAAGKEADPETEKQVEVMKQMAEELDPTGGLNRDWWLEGY